MRNTRARNITGGRSRLPSIRYLTLRHLLGRSETDADVQAVQQDMRTTGPIPAILAEQTETGHWAGERSYYTLIS